jgi:hypothetical protein
MYKEPVQEVEFLKGLLAVQVEQKKKVISHTFRDDKSVANF